MDLRDLATLCSELQKSRSLESLLLMEKISIVKLYIVASGELYNFSLGYGYNEEMKEPSRVMVVAGVIQTCGKVLIAQRRKEGRLGGKWEFPGGKVEPDETPEQALKRELHEELGIEAEIGAFLCSSRYDYPHLAVELHAYRIMRFSGEIVPTVHDQVLWVLPQDVCKYDFPAANQEIIRRLDSPS